VRRLIILGILYAVLQGVFQLAGPAAGAPVLMMFGFLVLAAYSVGELAKAVGLPKIVGYLLGGVLFGPSGLNFVSTPVLSEFTPISNLAIALIAFLAGAELQWSEIRSRGVSILKIMVSESGLAFVALAVTFAVLHGQLEFLRGAPPQEIAAFALLFASVAVVHSPAVTMGVLTETGAKGTVARTTLGVVLLADVAVVLTFSGALALARVLVPPSSGEAVAFGAVVWEIAGAVLVGLVLGGIVAAYLRFIRRELFIFAILVAMLGAEVARLTHVETLLMLLVAGFVAENAAGGRGHEFRHAMERAAAPVFVVFFALAGAKIVPASIVALWPIAVPLVLVRMLAIWGGTQLGARWARTEPVVAQNAWLGLVSQAGVALGLAAVAADVYPQRGAELRALFLAIIAINETVGPALFRFGLMRSGELARGGEAVSDASTGDDGTAGGDTGQFPGATTPFTLPTVRPD
jgi:Kef-type K+ transport system membrane component KefB